MSIASRRLLRGVVHTTSGGGALELPLVPWEGGPAYWAQFSKANAAGWTDPSFFPIISAPNSFSSSEEVLWDKNHGINTYLSVNPWSHWDFLTEHNMFYIGWEYTYEPTGQEIPANHPQWVGYTLEDEIDGLYATREDALARLGVLRDTARSRNDGRFLHNNFTRNTVSSQFPWRTQFINDYTDVVSLDMYFYTIQGYHHDEVGWVSDVNLPGGEAFYSAAYGGMARGLRQVDATDGIKQPVWVYVENLSGSPGEASGWQGYISPPQLKGAVMSTLINEARGVLYFNNVANELHGVGNPLRQAQVYGTNFEGYYQIQALGEVNNQIQSLAPVLNTQSYVWSFGANIETMLKASGGFVYIFAMIGPATATGSRTFTLPPGITGTTVTVVDESRNLTVSAGQFSDTFAFEYSYHIYKISL